MKKNLRSVLTMLLVLMMALTTVVPVIGYALEATPASVSNSDTPIDSYGDGWLKIDQYDEDGDGNTDKVVVTLTPDIDSAKEIDRAEVKDILNEVITIAKDLVINDLKSGIVNGQYGEENNGNFGGLESLWEDAFNQYLETTDYEGYVDFFKAAIAKEGSVRDNELISGLVDYACSLISTANKLGAVSLEQLEQYKVGLADKIVGIFNDKLTELINTEKDKYLAAYMAYMFDGAERQNNSVFDFADAELIDYITTSASNVLGNSVNGKLETLIAATNSALEIISTGDTQKIEKFKELIASDEAVKAEIRQEVEANINVATEGYETEVYEIVLGITKAELDEKLLDYAYHMQTEYALTVTSLKNVDKSISIRELLTYLNYVSIGGNVLYENGQINIDGFKGLLRSIPLPNEIVNMSDDEMELGYNIEIGTRYGKCDFTLVGKVGGGYDEIRTICRIISDHFDIRLTGNNSVDIDITVPAKFSEVILRAANSGKLSDALKDKIFSAFNADGEELYALYNDITFEDLITLLECIDFNGLFDKEFIKQYVDLTGLSNEEILNFVKKYERYFNIAKRYADKVVRIGYNKISNDYPQYLDNTILSVFDHKNDPNDQFSYSNGDFSYVGTHSIRYGFVLENMEEYLNKLGEKLYGKFPEYVDEDSPIRELGSAVNTLINQLLPNISNDDYFTATLDLSVSVEKINMIEYYDKDGSFIREGLLPVGADVQQFSAPYGSYTCEGFLGWYDVNTGKQIIKMPDHDVVLKPIIAGQVDIIPSENVNVTYDPDNSFAIGVIVGDITNEYSYKWEKDGKPYSANTSTITVKDVADSGTYTVIVTCDSNPAITETRHEIKVTIAKATVNPEGVELKEDELTWTGSQVVAEVVIPEELKKLVNVNIEGNIATDCGVHTAVVKLTLKDAANYKFTTTDDASLTIDLPWTIKREIDLSIFSNPLYWEYSGNYNPYPMTYDGKEHSVSFKLPDEYKDILNFEGYTDDSVTSATNAGVYNVKAQFTAKQPEIYRLVGEASIEWEIIHQNINISDVYEWVVPTEAFAYNGKEQSVSYKVQDTELAKKLAEFIKVTPKNTAATNAGTYIAELVFELDASKEGSSNYNLEGTLDTLTWTIEKQSVNVDDFKWTDTTGWKYDGSFKTVEVIDLPSFVSASYAAAYKAKNADSYTAVAVLTLLDSDNYVLVNSNGDETSTTSYDWTISKSIISIDEITWTTADEIYSKSEFIKEILPGLKITLNGEDVENALEFLLVQFAENSANKGTVVGSYEQIVTITSVDAANYDVVIKEGVAVEDIEGTLTAKHTWKIDKATITIESLNWGDILDSYVYRGEKYTFNTLPTITVKFNGETVDAEGYVSYGFTNTSLNEAENVGNYKLVVEFTYDDVNCDIVIAEGVAIENLVAEKAWSITPAEIQVVGFEWGTLEFVYDGTVHSVAPVVSIKLNGEEVSAGDVFKYINAIDFGTSETSAQNYAEGGYNAIATITLKDGVNYILKNAEGVEVEKVEDSKKWTINKAVITVTDITWSANTSFTYNGSVQGIALPTVTIKLNGNDATTAEYVSIAFANDSVNEEINAGNYTAKIVITPIDDANYSLVNELEEKLEQSWEIKKAGITLSDIIEWNYTNAFTFNGSAHTVVPSIKDSYKSIYSPILTLNTDASEHLSETNAGTYIAKAVYTVDASSNYQIVGDNFVTLDWTVNKLEIKDYFKFEGGNITVGDIVGGDNVKVEANGTFPITGVNVLDLVNIAYEPDGSLATVGEAVVTATITVKDEYKNNYQYTGADLEATFNVEAAGGGTVTPPPAGDKSEFGSADGTVNVEITDGGAISTDHEFGSSNVTDDVDKKYEDKDGNKYDVLAAYDITFTKDGVNVTFDGDGKTFKVSLLIPEEYRGLDDDELMVIWIKDDGSIEVMEGAKRVGDYMEFETNHFSVYAVVRVEAPSLLWLWILLAVLAVAGIAVLVYFLLKNREKKPETPDIVEVPHREDVEGAEKAPEEITEPEEEPVAEEEEAPIAEEEEPEVVDEIEEVEEAPEEEIPEEEEAPVVEEEALVEEAPVEEEPVEEAPVEEEPVEEEPIEEAPVEEEPVVEVPKTAAIVIEDNVKATTAMIGDQVVLIRFRRSFMSRLIQSTEKVQSFYTAIKNQLLSYKGVKARGSWNYEAFNKGRIQCCKLNIKGKTLIVNLNLNPADYNINKYHFVDCSAKPKYAKVPMMMKVRSERALKYTLELIDEMMKGLGVPQIDVPAVDYHMPYESTEELAKRGLVKIILPAGVTLSEDMRMVQMDVSTLIESGTAEKTTEQIMPTEEAPVEEAPVEEAPAEESPVEEAPVEEAPVEEAPVEEAPADEAPAEEAPVEEAPAEEAPAEEAPAEEAPVEEAPVEEAPVEEAPAEEAPVEEAPAEEAPVEEAPAEEAPVEEAPAEEAPAEEAPVEEAPAEEAPAEEAPVEEAPVEDDGTIHVDASTADTLVSDEEAEAHIEIIHTGASARSGKMGEINLDIICENFEDGDVVDVEALRAKRLVSQKVVRVKILARGIMTKRLTIIASKFSLQAVKMIKLAGGRAELED